MKILRQWFSDFRGGRLPIGNLFQTAKNEKFPPQERAFFVEDNRRIPERLRFPGRFTETAYLRQCGNADWQNVDDDVKEFAARFIEEARKRGIPLYVHSAYRTKAQQTEVWARRASRAQWPRAAHCQGKAVDIVHSVFNWDMSIEEWAYLHWLGADTLRKMNAGRLKARLVTFTWGGDWDGDGDIHDHRLYDPAHWEKDGWKDDIRKLPESEPIRATPRGLLARY